MPLNKACIGKQYPPISTRVTLEALQKYARACNDENPRFFNPDLPGGIVAPPLFSVTLTWVSLLTALTDIKLQADLLHLLHIAQDMEFAMPVRPGDIIRSTAKILSIEPHSHGETIAIELDGETHGETIGKTIFTSLIRGHRDPAARDELKNASPGGATNGEPIISVAQTIDRDQTLRYADASGDRNPIHLDTRAARMAGLPGVVVHGLCTMAFTSKVMVDHLCGGDPTRLKRLAVRFAHPVFPGDTITTRLWPDGERNKRNCYIYETYNTGGVPVIRDGLAEIAP